MTVNNRSVPHIVLRIKFVHEALWIIAISSHQNRLLLNWIRMRKTLNCLRRDWITIEYRNLVYNTHVRDALRGDFHEIWLAYTFECSNLLLFISLAYNPLWSTPLYLIEWYNHRPLSIFIDIASHVELLFCFPCMFRCKLHSPLVSFRVLIRTV